MRYPLIALASLLASALSFVVACSSDSDPSAVPPNGTEPDATAADGSSGTEEDASTPKDGAGGDASLLAARPYEKTVPAKYDAKVPTSLVLLLHGYRASGKIQDDYFQLSVLAEKKGFLVATPDGTIDAQGYRHWNATDACCHFIGPPPDDVAYLTAVIADMKAKYNVDPKRVYVVGHSNGGFMANRLACELSKDIAGIVSLAGAAYKDASKCKATDPVAVLQVHGDADDLVLYAGGSFYAGLPVFPGAKETVAQWATKNGCGTELITGATKLDVDSTLPADETTVQSHTCTKGAAELWTIVGGGHIPTLQPTWAEMIYGFLEAHPKP